ncbi:hypothetical protein Bca101_024844 [Brassica carinata]
MSLLLRRFSSLGHGKPPVSVRSSFLSLSQGFSTSLLQTPPCKIMFAEPCGADLGKLVVLNFNELYTTELKKVPLELVNDDDAAKITIGASHGWIATLKEDGILRLQDDLNPVASDTYPKRIPLPPLVTLPHCQTKIITNVSMSLSSPEDDEDCVVAVQWDPSNPRDDPKFQSVRFKDMPKLSKAKQNLMDFFCRSEHLVESRPTGETFLVKQYKKTIKITKAGIARMRTKALMLFKLDEEGNAVYTQDIGDLVMFLSMSEPFCVPATSFPGLYPNYVRLYDFDELGFISLNSSYIRSRSSLCLAPYHIPPQNIVEYFGDQIMVDRSLVDILLLDKFFLDSFVREAFGEDALVKHAFLSQRGRTKKTYADSGLMFRNMQTCSPDIHQFEDLFKSYKLSDDEMKNGFAERSNIPDYDIVEEGDLFEAPDSIPEEPISTVDPLSAALRMISCGEVSSQGLCDLPDLDLGSLQSGQQLLDKAFYECEKDLMMKSAMMESPLSEVLDIKNISVVTTGINENQDMQKSSILFFDERKLGTVHFQSPLDRIIVNCTSEDRREKLSRYRNEKSRRNFGHKIKYACRKALADNQPRIRGRFSKTEERK